jgi:hypothetical protein
MKKLLITYGLMLAVAMPVMADELRSNFGTGSADYEQTYWLTNKTDTESAVTVNAFWFQTPSSASERIGKEDASLAALPANTTVAYSHADIEKAIGQSINGLYWVVFNTSPKTETSALSSGDADGFALLGTLGVVGSGAATYASTPLNRYPYGSYGELHLASVFNSGNANYEQTYWINNYGKAVVDVTVTAYTLTNQPIGTENAKLGNIQPASSVGISLAEIGEAVQPKGGMNGLYRIVFTLTDPKEGYVEATGRALLGTLTDDGDATYLFSTMTHYHPMVAK